MVHHLSFLANPPSSVTKGRFKMRWSVLLGLCVLYDLMLLPLYVFYAPSGVLFSMLEWFTHLVWNVDMGVSALTGFYLQGILVLEPAQTLRHYMQSWMAFDVFLVLLVWVNFAVSVLAPEQAEQGELMAWARTLRTLRFLRFVRILRWLKLRRVVETLQQVVGSPATSLYFSLFSNVARLLILNHLVACCWFGITHIAGEPSWVSENSVASKSVLDQYLKSLNWSFAQLGVGSTNIFPTNTLEEAYSVIIAIRSLLTYATLVSTMTNLMTGLSKIREGEETDFRLLYAYLKANDIPEALRRKVARFVEHQYRLRTGSKVGDDDIPVLSLLSPQLRGELMLAKYRKSLCKLPLVRELLDLENVQVVQVMHHVATTAVRDIAVAAGDLVFYAGSAASAAFQKLSGDLRYQVEVDDEVVASRLWIAEVCLYTPWVYQGDLLASEVSRLLVLDADAFRESLCQCRLTQKAASEHARQFVIQMTDAAVMTDLPRRGLQDLETEVEAPKTRPALWPVLYWRHWLPTWTFTPGSGQRVTPEQRELRFDSLQGSR